MHRAGPPCPRAAWPKLRRRASTRVDGATMHLRQSGRRPGRLCPSCNATEPTALPVPRPYATVRSAISDRRQTNSREGSMRTKDLHWLVACAVLASPAMTALSAFAQALAPQIAPAPPAPQIAPSLVPSYTVDLMTTEGS